VLAHDAGHLGGGGGGGGLGVWGAVTDNRVQVRVHLGEKHTETRREMDKGGEGVACARVCAYVSVVCVRMWRRGERDRERERERVRERVRVCVRMCG
jgi:hypothetical protein